MRLCSVVASNPMIPLYRMDSLSNQRCLKDVTPDNAIAQEEILASVGIDESELDGRRIALANDVEFG